MTNIGHQPISPFSTLLRILVLLGMGAVVMLAITLWSEAKGRAAGSFPQACMSFKDGATRAKCPNETAELKMLVPARGANAPF